MKRYTIILEIGDNKSDAQGVHSTLSDALDPYNDGNDIKIVSVTEDKKGGET